MASEKFRPFFFSLSNMCIQTKPKNHRINSECHLAMGGLPALLGSFSLNGSLVFRFLIAL